MRAKVATSQDQRTVSVSPCPDCYVCGARGRPLYQNLSDRLFDAPGDWNLVSCPNPDCGLAWLDPMPLTEEIGKLYGSYYTHGTAAGSEDPPGYRNHLIRALRGLYTAALRVTGVAGQRERMKMLFLDRQDPGSVLDVGCGNGERLLLFRERGWEIQGQDVDPKAAERARARGVKVHIGALGALDLPQDSLDAVIIYHVIEHVPDPLAVLKECHRLLRPGGSLALATPNIRSAGHRRFESAWRDLDPPRHLHLFSPEALRSTVQRAGLEIDKLWTTSAHGSSIARGSLDIRDSGHHDMATATRLDKNLVIALMFYQPLLSLQCMLGDGVGEECVLTARKPTTGDIPVAHVAIATPINDRRG